MIDAVVTTLDKLIGVQRQLIDIAERKRMILIERKVDELNQLVQDEATLVKQLNQLEDEREQLVDKLLQQHPSLTFSQLIEQIPDNTKRDKLQLQRETLQQCIIELQAKNKVNETLLKDSLSFVHHMIDQVTKSKQQQFNYQSPLDKQKSSTSNRGFFDTKA